MVEEAMVDCYNESEQVDGLFTLLQEHLAVPFASEFLGLPITVERVELNPQDEIVAVCTRAGHRQDVPILNLPLPTPVPTGTEWIAAYRHWSSGA